MIPSIASSSLSRSCKSRMGQEQAAVFRTICSRGYTTTGASTATTTRIRGRFRGTASYNNGLYNGSTRRKLQIHHHHQQQQRLWHPNSSRQMSFFKSITTRRSTTGRRRKATLAPPASSVLAPPLP